jgi:HEAT repeat protein
MRKFYHLIAKIEKKSNYLNVYELGFGNNKSAINFLVKLTKSKKEYIRQTAISSLGILKVEDQVEHIKALYDSAKSWSDKAIVIKALLDIGSENAVTFVDSKVQSFTKPKEIEWSTDIISLYK